MPYANSHDPLASNSGTAETPARSAAAVTPSDSTDLTTYAKALWVNVGGDVAVIPVGNADNASVIFTVAGAGLLPVEVRRVLSAGTTATGILALWN